MSDTRKRIIFEIDTATGKVRVDGLTKSFNSLSDAARAANKEILNVNNANADGRKQSGAFGSSIIEFSRVVQDANYGIRGMANNITQLASQLALAAEGAGGFNGLVKGLIKALSGPGGVILAVSAVVSLFEAYDQKTRKAKEATKEFTLELALLKQQMDLLQPSADEVIKNLEAYSVLMNSNLTLDQKALALQKMKADADAAAEGAKKSVVELLKDEVRMKNELNQLENAEIPNVERIIYLRESLLGIEERNLQLKREAATDFSEQARLEAKILDVQIQKSNVRNEVEQKYAFFLKDRPKDLKKVETAQAGVVLYGMKPYAEALVETNKAEITFTQQSIMLAEARFRAWQDAARAAMNLSQTFSQIIDAQAEIDLNNAIARGEDEEAARLRIEKKKQAFMVKAAKFEAAIQLAMLGAQISRDVAAGLLSVQVGYANTAKIGFPQATPFLIAYAAQAAAIIAGIIAAKKKAEAAISGLKVSNISPGSAPGGNIVQPNFNIVGGTGVNQLAEAVNGQLQNPIKTYVVSKDVASAIELERNIVSGSSIS